MTGNDDSRPGSAPGRAIVFDFGGVLWDWNPRHLFETFDLSDDELTAFFEEVCTPEWNMAHDIIGDFRSGVAILQTRFPRYRAEIAAFDERWGEMIRAPIEGMPELVAALLDRGVALYGLTNFPDAKLSLVLERFDFLRRFAGIVTSSETGYAKPSAKIYQRLIRIANRRPEHLLFFDDRPENVEAARACGMRAELFRSPEAAWESIETFLSAARSAGLEGVAQAG
jgi:2-haloacid dehalogenase